MRLVFDTDEKRIEKQTSVFSPEGKLKVFKFIHKVSKIFRVRMTFHANPPPPKPTTSRPYVCT